MQNAEARRTQRDAENLEGGRVCSFKDHETHEKTRQNTGVGGEKRKTESRGAESPEIHREKQAHDEFRSLHPLSSRESLVPYAAIPEIVV